MPAPAAEPSRSSVARPAGDDAGGATRKRLRLRAVQLHGEELHHADEGIELYDESAEAYGDCVHWDDDFDDAEEFDAPQPIEGDPEIPAILIRPLTDEEPVSDPQTDQVAEDFELERLMRVKVLSEAACKADDHNTLTARYVNSWRVKALKGERVYLSRARPVVREYRLDPNRQSFSSPATSCVMTRVIPGLFLQQCQNNWPLLGFDIADAYLLCEQKHPTTTKINNEWLTLHRQREGSAEV